MDWSSPGSSVHGIFQARILEWAAISFSRWSSWCRDQTCISYIDRRVFYHWATREGLQKNIDEINGLRLLASIKKFKQTNKPKAKFDNWLGILSGRPGPTNTILWQDSIFVKQQRWMTHEICSLDWQEPRDLAEKILTPLSQASCQLSLTRKTFFFPFQFHYRAELVTTLTTSNSLFSW